MVYVISVTRSSRLIQSDFSSKKIEETIFIIVAVFHGKFDFIKKGEKCWNRKKSRINKP